MARPAAFAATPAAVVAAVAPPLALAGSGTLALVVTPERVDRGPLLVSRIVEALFPSSGRAVPRRQSVGMAFPDVPTPAEHLSCEAAA